MIPGIFASQVAASLSCLHPLTLSEAILQANGYTGRLALSNDNKTGTYTIVPYGSYVQYAAAPELGDVIDGSSGKVAFRWMIDRFDPANAGLYRANLFIFDSTATTDLYHLEYYAFSSGAFQLYVVQGGSTTVYTGSTSGSPASFVDVGLDAPNGKLHLFMDGTELTMTNGGTLTPQAVFPAITAVQGSYSASSASPAYIRMSLLFEAADMAGATWLAGYTDSCGVPIPS